MILLPPQLRYALRANAICSNAAEAKGERFDPLPILKFFNPLGTGTWLATELYPDNDTLFGLADLGFGCPEMGTFSLMDIRSVRLPFGMGIERDIGFSTTHPLSLWAEYRAPRWVDPVGRATFAPCRPRHPPRPSNRSRARDRRMTRGA